MKHDRRDFLKLFGLTTAAVAAAEGSAANIEVLHAPPVPAPKSQTLAIFKPAIREEYNTYDVRDEPLWSILRVERNAMKEQYYLFDVPAGSTYTDTNLCQPHTLINPEAYAVKKIGFVFSPQTLPALRSAFIDRYTVQVAVGRKNYFEAPLAAMFCVAEPDREKGFATLPDSGFVQLEIPLILVSGVRFAVTVSGKAIHPCGKITGWAVFKGLHYVGIC